MDVCVYVCTYVRTYVGTYVSWFSAKRGVVNLRKLVGLLGGDHTAFHLLCGLYSGL